jgi:hypothetical protein
MKFSYWKPKLIDRAGAVAINQAFAFVLSCLATLLEYFCIRGLRNHRNVCENLNSPSQVFEFFAVRHLIFTIGVYAVWRWFLRPNQPKH